MSTNYYEYKDHFENNNSRQICEITYLEVQKHIVMRGIASIYTRVNVYDLNN